MRRASGGKAAAAALNSALAESLYHDALKDVSPFLQYANICCGLSTEDMVQYVHILGMKGPNGHQYRDCPVIMVQYVHILGMKRPDGHQYHVWPVIMVQSICAYGGIVINSAHEVNTDAF
ncbi:MAG: hypothetical protein NC389_05170 [Acetatifactor muris]|nr:hypothetical protein [Acetatifactor muris]